MQPVLWPPTRTQFLLSCPHHEEHGFVYCYVEYSPLALQKGSGKRFFLLAKLLSVETERESLISQRATLLSSIPLLFTAMATASALPHMLNRATEVLPRHVSHMK